MNRREWLLGIGAFGLLTKSPAMANEPLYVPPEEAPHTQNFMMWPASRRVYDCKYHNDCHQLSCR